MKNKELKSTAFHEAGHAFAHLWFERPFKYVTIVPNKTTKTFGHLMGMRNERIMEILEYDAPTADEERYLKHEMIILMAGGVAEAKHMRRRKLPSGANGDVHELVAMCGSMGMTNKMMRLYRFYIIEEAKQLLYKRLFWPVVKDIARELKMKKTLSYEECMDLYRKHLGGDALRSRQQSQ